jgi:hypothetical protein
MFLSLAERDDVRTRTSLGVDHHNDFASEPTEHHEALLSINLPDVFTGDREFNPDGLAADEVQAVCLDVGETLSLVPRGHDLIVVTKRLGHKLTLL